jgi:hypothetical protein
MPKPKTVDVRPELPFQPQVGDRIKLKESVRSAFVADCRKAGWDVDPDAIRIVTREDPFNPGGGRRLFVDGPPFCFATNQVELAWNTEDERRDMLKADGWAV